MLVLNRKFFVIIFKIKSGGRYRLFVIFLNVFSVKFMLRLRLVSSLVRYSKKIIVGFLF